MVPLRPSTIIRPVLVFCGVLWIYDVGHSQLYEVETGAILRAQREASPPETGSHIPDQTSVFKVSPIVSAEALASGDDQGICQDTLSGATVDDLVRRATSVVSIMLGRSASSFGHACPG